MLGLINKALISPPLNIIAQTFPSSFFNDEQKNKMSLNQILVNYFMKNKKLIIKR